MDEADFSSELSAFGYRFWYQRKSTWIAVILAVFVLWFTPWIPALYLSSIEVTRLDAKGKPIKVEVGPKTKQWVKVESVSKHLLHAIVVAEDGKFYQHHGFDFDAMRKAYALNKKTGKFSRGGSTISQQVVKMAFLSREKTYTRKLREAVGTTLMELFLSKEKILEWYINLTEFGGGIYGVKQAGQYYFKTRPELLTTEQAIHLALVIPSPNKWSKGLRSRSLTPFGHRRFLRIAHNLAMAGYITEAEKQTVLARGNFGAPIAGSRAAQIASDDDDDCKGDKDCDEDDDRGKASSKIDSNQKNPSEPTAEPSVGVSPPATSQSIPPPSSPQGAAPVTPEQNGSPAESPPGVVP